MEYEMNMLKILYLVGMYSVIVIGIIYMIITVRNLDLIKTDPCQACINLTGSMCYKISDEEFIPLEYGNRKNSVDLPIYSNDNISILS